MNDILKVLFCFCCEPNNVKSDQNFDNKDKVEILPNGVKVIWQFYKPKKEKAFDPQSSDKSLEDSKDSYGNRASAGKRASTKSSSRSGYHASGRAGASASASTGVKAAIKVKVRLISLKRAHKSLQLIQVLLKKTTTMIVRSNSIIANLMLWLTSLVMTFMPIITQP